MHRWYEFYSGRLGVALLLMRFVVGLAFIFHGLPKVTDVEAFAGQFNLPFWLAAFSAWTEVIGGALLLLGLLTPVAAIGIAAQMLGALATVHVPRGDPFVNPGGPSFELPLLFLTIAIALLLSGPGAYSLDALIARRMERTEAAPAVGRRRGTA